MKVDRNICIGMMASGALGYFSNEEVINNDGLQYLAKHFKKKHFSFRQASPKDRIKRNVNAIIKSENKFQLHAHIANNVWNNTSDKMTKEISVIALIYFLLTKSPDTIKFYGFNENKLKKIYDDSPHKNMLTFQSMRTASKILEMLDIELAHYYENLKRLKQQKVKR